jgi:hypothetical protein
VDFISADTVEGCQTTPPCTFFRVPAPDLFADDLLTSVLLTSVLLTSVLLMRSRVSTNRIRGRDHQSQFKPSPAGITCRHHLPASPASVAQSVRL